MQIFVSNPLNFILLLLSNLLLFHTKIHADYLTQKCTDTATYTSNSPFETNLQKLFSSISTNAPPTGFSNASSGNDPDRVYGLAQCRGDVNVEICKSCVDSAIKKIQEACPNKKSGIIWFRDCLVRYSHEDFLGNVDVSSRIVIWNVNNKSEEENRSNHARVLVDRLVGECSSSPIDTSMPTREEGDSTPTRQEGAGVGIIGQRKHSRKLNNHHKRKKHHKMKSQTRVAVMTSVAVVLGVALLVGCIYFFYPWWSKRSRKVNGVSQPLVENDEVEAT